MAIECDATLKFERDDDVGLYQSSEWGERGFCKKCGTPLFYKLRGKDYYIVSTEAFDDTQDFKFVQEIFIDEKPAHYAFANNTKKMTGAEVFAAFGASQDGSNG